MAIPLHNHSEYSQIDGLSKINEIADRTLEQNRVGVNFAFAAAMDGDMSFFRERAIKCCDLLHGGAGIKQFPLDRFTSCIHSRHEEEVVHDSRQPFAFGNVRFDDFAILTGRALPGQGDLALTHNVGNRRAQFVGEIG